MQILKIKRSMLRTKAGRKAITAMLAAGATLQVVR